MIFHFTGKFLLFENLVLTYFYNLGFLIDNKCQKSNYDLTMQNNQNC
jgi:hypothetical protein